MLVILLLFSLVAKGKGIAEECGGNYLNGHCYTVSSKYVVYSEAVRKCEGANSTLLSTMSESEIQLVLSRLHRTVWLAPELGEEDLLAELGKAKQGKEDRAGDGEEGGLTTQNRCPAFYPIKEMRVWQVSCTTLLPYVCKKRMMPSTAAPPTTPVHTTQGCMRELNPLSEAALTAHNMKRAQHQNTPPLCWNWELEVSAERYAWKLGEMGGVEHDTGNRHGENIYSALHSHTRPLVWYYKHAVEQWYREIRFYNWDRPGGSTSYGHFTQLVWRSTYLVGCGHGYGLNMVGKKRIVVVCRYSPPGSLTQNTYYRANVQPLREL